MSTTSTRLVQQLLLALVALLQFLLIGRVLRLELVEVVLDLQDLGPQTLVRRLDLGQLLLHVLGLGGGLLQFPPLLFELLLHLGL